MLLFITVMATVVFYVPGITAQKAKQSAWLVPLVASPAGFMTVWFTWKLGQRFPNQTLPQYSVVIVGKFLGKIIAGAYLLFLFVFDSLVIREFVDFINEDIMPNTPSLVLLIAVVMVGGYGAYHGIEVIARMTQFILPLFMFGSFLILGLALKYFDYLNLLPFLEGGIKPLVAASISPAAWYGEAVILTLLIPFVNKSAEVKTKGILAIVGAAALLSLEILVSTAVLGAELSAYILYPFWYLVRFMEVPHIGLRFETIILIFWISGVVTKVTLIHFLLCLSAAQTFGWKSHRKVVFPAAFLVVIFAKFMANNILETFDLAGKFWPFFAFTFELLIPIFLYIIAKFRKKQGRMPA